MDFRDGEEGQGEQPGGAGDHEPEEKTVEDEEHEDGRGEIDQVIEPRLGWRTKYQGRLAAKETGRKKTPLMGLNVARQKSWSWALYWPR